jgi:hypothetical protein
VRVPFDPGAIDTVREFAARSLASMLTFGDHLLMLVCLVLPHRRVGRAARLLAALVAGQALTIAAGAAVPQQVGALAPAGAFVAASVVVVAAAQNIVDARFSWTAALAFAFGVLNGVTLGADFASASQLAGAHRGVALATVLLVVAAAQLWLGAVLWATRAWLATKRVPERMLTLVASAILAHSAVHAVIDRGQVLAASGIVDADRALTGLTLAWAFVMLAVAGLEALRVRSARSESARAHAS